MVFQDFFSIPLKACLTGNYHFHLSSVTRSSFPFPIKKTGSQISFFIEKKKGAKRFVLQEKKFHLSLSELLRTFLRVVFSSPNCPRLMPFSIQSYTLCRATPCTLFSLSLCLASCCKFWKGSRRERRSTFIKRCESIHSGKNESRQRQKRGKQEAKAIVLF
ncbi:hypothetical protein IEQ34_024204 [Dendrobium chrysotoxum]|uniref:Uncharacterized protein n=1 Tax=Dendrobium chrysotoxum TaxID=161865 RepID=A0AAV7FT49_DENCH|nr:hypothetical protein IEQ34_024204 [Dendrobium chrysotoxum]